MAGQQRVATASPHDVARVVREWSDRTLLDHTRRAHRFRRARSVDRAGQSGSGRCPFRRQIGRPHPAVAPSGGPRCRPTPGHADSCWLRNRSLRPRVVLRHQSLGARRRFRPGTGRDRRGRPRALQDPGPACGRRRRQARRGLAVEGFARPGLFTPRSPSVGPSLPLGVDPRHTDGPLQPARCRPGDRQRYQESGGRAQCVSTAGQAGGTVPSRVPARRSVPRHPSLPAECRWRPVARRANRSGTPDSGPRCARPPGGSVESGPGRSP